MFYLLIFFGSVAATYFGVEVFRRWSLRRGVLDVPNERSLHNRPIPRGGGLVIVVVTMLAYTIISIFFQDFFAWTFLAGSLLIATISWLDDLYSVNVLLRFCVHSAAALLVIFEVGYFELVHLPSGFETIELGGLGLVITFLWVVWVINAFNFMDGIDGIAGSQAVVSTAGWFAIALMVSIEPGALFALAIAGSCLGFLVHNWPPAKIFMGDVGSAYLGFVIAVLPLLLARGGSIDPGILPWLALSMIWLFVFDTVFTFCTRMVGRQRVWQAHRDHTYQTMVLAGNSHTLVTSIYIIMGVAVGVSAVLLLLGNGFFSSLQLLVLAASASLLLILRWKSRIVFPTNDP